MGFVYRSQTLKQGEEECLTNLCVLGKYTIITQVWSLGLDFFLFYIINALSFELFWRGTFA